MIILPTCLSLKITYTPPIISRPMFFLGSKDIFKKEYHYGEHLGGNALRTHKVFKRNVKNEKTVIRGTKMASKSMKDRGDRGSRSKGSILDGEKTEQKSSEKVSYKKKIETS